jgi:hypothetical protein
VAILLVACCSCANAATASAIRNCAFVSYRFFAAHLSFDQGQNHGVVMQAQAGHSNLPCPDASCCRARSMAHTAMMLSGSGNPTTVVTPVERT